MKIQLKFAHISSKNKQSAIACPDCTKKDENNAPTTPNDTKENTDIEEGNSVTSSTSSVEPADPLTKEDDDDEFKRTCAICLDVFKEHDEVSWSKHHKCEHVFHHECIIPWLKRHDECPYCRCNYVMPNDNGITPFMSSPSGRRGNKFEDKKIIHHDDFIFCVNHGLVARNTGCYGKDVVENHPCPVATAANNDNRFIWFNYVY